MSDKTVEPMLVWPALVFLSLKVKYRPKREITSASPDITALSCDNKLFWWTEIWRDPINALRSGHTEAVAVSITFILPEWNSAQRFLSRSFYIGNLVDLCRWSMSRRSKTLLFWRKYIWTNESLFLGQGWESLGLEWTCHLFCSYIQELELFFIFKYLVVKRA